MTKGNYGSFSPEEIYKVIWDRPSEVLSDTVLSKATELRMIREITADLFPFVCELCTHDNFTSERHMLNLLDWLKHESGRTDWDKIYSLRRMRVEDFKKHIAQTVKGQERSGQLDLTDGAHIMLRIQYNKFFHQNKDQFSICTTWLSLELKLPIFKVLDALNVMSEGEWDIPPALNSVYEYVNQTGQVGNPQKPQIALF